MDTPLHTTVLSPPIPVPPIRLLVVEDEPSWTELIFETLLRDQLSFTRLDASDETSFLKALASLPDLILCDQHIPSFSATRALSILSSQPLPLPLSS